MSDARPMTTMDELVAAHSRAETRLLDDMEAALNSGQKPIEALADCLIALAKAHVEISLLAHVTASALHLTFGKAQPLAERLAALEKKALRHEGDWDMGREYAPGAVVRSKGVLYVALREILPDKAEPQRQGSGWDRII